MAVRMPLRELHNSIAGAIGRLRGGKAAERNDPSTLELLVAAEDRVDRL